MAALRSDELEFIAKKLTFGPDYTRFRSVCKTWRSAAPKQPQLPWLIASAVSCTKFYQFSFEAQKFTEIPELSKPSLLSSFLDNPHVLIRASRGWLFLLDLRTKSVSLINPLTDSIINLPNLHSVDFPSSKYDIDDYCFGFSLTSDPGESISDCFASVYYSEMLYYCKVGSSVWSEMQHPEFDRRRGNIHICCYSGKLFLALGSDVFVCKFGDDPSICKLVSVGLTTYQFQETYLVESDGELLIVLVYHIKCHTCKVFKLEFGQQQAKLVELKCLCDRTLFLGLQDTTFSLDASRYPGCKKNSIYIPVVYDRSEEQPIFPSLIIYDCEKEGPIHVDGNIPAFSIPCDWFTPSLLL